MAKNSKPVPKGHLLTKSASPVKEDIKNNSGTTVPYPFWILVLIAVVVYLPTLWMGFTELDDSIFIKEFSRYNSDLSNLFASFHRGLFDAVKDPYYRPLFLDSIILNFHLFGQDILGYHLVNIGFHALAVGLLYTLLMSVSIRPVQAFVLSLIFAVHPVLCQAVAWIPGRNDTMLAIFTFAFLIKSVKYAQNGKLQDLLISFIALILAYFTKETAIFVAPVAWVILVLYLGMNWRGKKIVMQYVVWVLSFMIWFVTRSAATIAHNALDIAQVGGDFVQHLPVVIQYLGKVMLPVNLSVFPTQQDTVIYYGLLALLLLIAGIFLSKTKPVKPIVGSLLVFLILLIPVLLVPQSIDKQTYEHRLYLPFIGLLLLLPQLDWFKNIVDAKILKFGIGLCILLAALNLKHQRNFTDPLSFWTQAAETSPHSAYANMMLGARTDDTPEAARLFRKAYSLDPAQKYLNFYMAEMLQKEDSVIASEPYLQTEKKTSGYYKCNFLLARVAMAKKDVPEAIGYLSAYLRSDSLDVQANYNLYFLYLQTGQMELAAIQANACINRFQVLLQHDPVDKLANSDLLLMYFQTRDVARARSQLQHMQTIGLQVPNEYVPATVIKAIMSQ